MYCTSETKLTGARWCSRSGQEVAAGDVVRTGMKTDRIWTDITNIIFVFIFLVGFRFEYG